MKRLELGRYDYASYFAFSSYALCSLSIPIVLVAMGKELSFPLDDGGMGAGGVLHAVRSVAMMAALLCCGAVAGKFGKRKTMGASMLVSGLGIMLCAFAHQYWLLLPFLVIAGLGEGTCEGIATPFVQDLHPERPERYVNMAHSFWSVGICVCVLGAGGLLTLGVSWRPLLFGGGLLAMLSGLAFMWRENPSHPYPERQGKIPWQEVCSHSGRICKSLRFWVYCAAMFAGAGAEFCLTFWAATFLQLNFNASAWVGGLGTAAIAAGMFAGRNFFGYIARDSNLKYILLICSLGTIPLTLLLSFITPEIFPSRELMFGVLMVILFLCGIGIAPYWPTLQVLGVKTLPELDSTLLYIYFSAVGIPGCGFFTWLTGVLGDSYDLKKAFYLIPATLFLYALIIFLDGWVFPRRKHMEKCQCG